jgi:hypothetical protein
MAELPGRLALVGDESTGYQLSNQTGLTLKAAGVMRRSASGNVETAWLGDIDPDATVPLRFVRMPAKVAIAATAATAANAANKRGPWQSERQGTVLGPATADGELNLEGLAVLAQNAEHIEPGEMRLIAAATEPIAGMQIEPSARQTEHAVLVVAHLAYGYGKDPQPDLNTPKIPAQIEAPVPWSKDANE